MSPDTTRRTSSDSTAHDFDGLLEAAPVLSPAPPAGPAIKQTTAHMFRDVLSDGADV